MSQIAIPKMNMATMANLLRLIGASTSGTKDVMITRLRRGLQQSPLQTSSESSAVKILSIDMGIRNLAFCVLDVTALAHLDPTGNKIRCHDPSTEVTNGLGSVFPYIRCSHWERLSLLERIADAHRDLEGAWSSRTELTDPDGPGIDPSSFQPAVFSKMTCKLVKEVFLPLGVSGVLIERQRHRSGGSSAVQEWTIRVNMLESMLHAMFEVLRHGCIDHNAKADEVNQRPKSIDASVDKGLPISTISISPQTVATFWCGSDAFLSGSSGPSEVLDRKRNGRKINKAQKINEVARWLEGIKGHGHTSAQLKTLPISDGALKTKDAFLAARRPRSQRPAGIAIEKKLDDLADCLLQAVAWAQWELNRKNMLQRLAIADQTEDQAKERSGICRSDL